MSGPIGSVSIDIKTGS